MDEERDRFWLSCACGRACSEVRTAPVQPAARLKDKMSWDRARAEGKGEGDQVGEIIRFLLLRTALD